MVATTPNYGLRYNQQGDPSSRLWQGSQDLATDVDAVFSGTKAVNASTIALQAGYTAPGNTPAWRTVIGITVLLGQVAVTTPAILTAALFGTITSGGYFGTMRTPLAYLSGTTWRGDGVLTVTTGNLYVTTPTSCNTISLDGIMWRYA